MTIEEKLTIAKDALASVERHVAAFDGIQGSLTHAELCGACSYAAMAVSLIGNLEAATPPKNPNYNK